MPKQSVSSAATAVAEPETLKTQVRKTYTNWAVFSKGNLNVTNVECVPLPGHPADEACKTKLIPTGENVLRHLQDGHGGGFQLTIEQGKIWPGWKVLADAGVEIQYIRDEVNDHSIPVATRALVAALKPHQGKFRGAWTAFHNQFTFSLGFTPPIPSEDDTDDASTYSE